MTAAAGLDPEPGARPGLDEEEAALWVALGRGDRPDVRERLFECHQPFARQLAAGRLRQGPADLSFDDLKQTASAALLEAIDRYDPRSQASFRTYAAKVIAGRLSDAVAKSTELRGQFAFRARVRRERARSLIDPEPGTARPDALSAFVDLAVGLAIGFMLEEEGFAATAERIDPYPTAYDSLLWKETVGRLWAELDGLAERDRFILKQHYLESLAFDQIADILGLSKGRVSQLHRAALTTLRKRLRTASTFSLQR